MKHDHKQSGLPQAIVIGLHAGGLALGRALNRLGFDVLGFYLDEAEPGRMSNCFSRVAPIPGKPAELVKVPQNNGAVPVPVFLTTDKALNWSRHRDNLKSSLLHFFQPEERIYQGWFQKTKMADMGAPLANILNPPRSTHLTEWQKLAREVTGPWVIKPVDSIIGEQYKVAKIQFVANERELRSVAEKYASIEDSILLQEWIPGDDDQHAFVGGYVDQEGRISIVQTGRKLKQHPVGMGVSIHSKMESIPELETCARQVLERIGHRGFFEFEWKWDTRINQWRYLEVNLRPWATLSLSSGYGILLIQKCLNDIGIAINASVPQLSEHPLEWVDDFTLALQAVRFRCGYPLRFKHRVAHAYWDKSDPRPFLFQWSHLISSKLKHH